VVKVKWDSRIWSTTMDPNFYLWKFQSKLARLHLFSTIIIFFFLDSSMSTSVNSGKRESVKTWKKQTLSKFVNHVEFYFFFFFLCRFSLLTALSCLLTSVSGCVLKAKKRSKKERKEMIKIYVKKRNFY